MSFLNFFILDKTLNNKIGSIRDNIFNNSTTSHKII